MTDVTVKKMAELSGPNLRTSLVTLWSDGLMTDCTVQMSASTAVEHDDRVFECNTERADPIGFFQKLGVFEKENPGIKIKVLYDSEAAPQAEMGDMRTFLE